MPRIYQVTANDTQVRFYFYPTKAEAEEKVREFVADYRTEGKAHVFDPPVIEPIDVAPTREGIAEALNNLIDQTCWNEG